MAAGDNNTTNLTTLTAEQVRSVLINPLTEASKFLSSGVTIIPTSGPLSIPKAPVFDLDSTALVAEGGSIPQVSSTGDALKLMPSTMKSVKVITRFTAELARQSVTSVEAALRASLVRGVAEKIDAAFLGDSNGATNTVPKGMFNYAGQSVAVDGPISFDALLAAQGKALAAAVDPANLKLWLSPDDWTYLRGLKDNAERYQLAWDPANASGLSVLGMPVILSSRLPSGSAAVADMSQVYVARDMDSSVTILNELYAGTDEVGIRAITRYDAGPANADAIVKLTGIDNTP